MLFVFDRIPPGCGAPAWGLMIYDLNPPTTLLDVSPLPLRGIPPSGGIALWLLLLGLRRESLTVAAKPIEEGAALRSSPGGGHR